MKFKDSAGIFHDIGMKFKDSSGVWHNVGAKFKDNEGIWHDVYPPKEEELILLGAEGTAANWTLSGGSGGSSSANPVLTKTDYLLKSSGGYGTEGSSSEARTGRAYSTSEWGKIEISGQFFGSSLYIKIRAGTTSRWSYTLTTGEKYVNYIIPISKQTSGTIHFEASSSSGGASFEITSVKLKK